MPPDPQGRLCAWRVGRRVAPRWPSLFLGSTSHGLLGVVTSEAAARHGAFERVTGHLASFTPRHGRKGVFLGVAPQEPLGALADDLRAALPAGGAPPNPMPFRPRLSVARSRTRTPLPDAPAPRRGGWLGSTSWRATWGLNAQNQGWTPPAPGGPDSSMAHPPEVPCAV